MWCPSFTPFAIIAVKTIPGNCTELKVAYSIVNLSTYLVYHSCNWFAIELIFDV
jgi:hypothetical protein